MEQHFQYVSKTFMRDQFLDSFAYHSAKHFTHKMIPQKWRDIMFFGILSTVNPIGSIKTWGKLSCALCMK